MSSENQQKNTIESSKISAQGDVHIGDKKTVNVYGVEASQRDVDYVIKFFMLLAFLFIITFIVSLFFPGPKKGVVDFIASFAAGGFFGLIALLIVFLVRSKNKSYITIK